MNCNRTGYTVRKWAHQKTTEITGVSLNKNHLILRYAEILLGYVEAMNECSGSYTKEVTGITVTKDVSEMVKHFNQIATAVTARNYEAEGKLSGYENLIKIRDRLSSSLTSPPRSTPLDGCTKVMGTVID